MRSIACCAVMLGLLSIAASGQSSSQPASLTGMIESILNEAQRQDSVSSDMVLLLGRFRALVSDLQSNHMMSQANGESLIRMADVIATTDRAHVRSAAEHLRSVGTSAPQAADASGVRAASQEIDQALALLTELLRQADALAAEVELRQIIFDQQTLTDETVRAGRDAIEKPDTNHAPPENLAPRQEEIAGRVSRLRTRLDTTLSGQPDADTGERLRTGAGIMDQRNIDVPLQTASRDIARGDLLAAAGRQRQALKDLNALAGALAGEGAKSAAAGAKGSDAGNAEGQKPSASSAGGAAAKPGPAGPEGGKMLGAAPDELPVQTLLPEKESRWQSLDDTQRQALDQSFARELPPEYRDLLEAYFQTLSRS